MRIMTLNYQTEYAMRIVIYLMLYPERVIPTREIADKYGLSVNHLNKVSQKLVRLDVISSSRGAGGGVKLNESSADMKIGDLMRKIEPNNEVAACAGAKTLKPCVISPVCQLRGLFAGAQQAFWDYLNQYKVSDLVHKNKPELKGIFDAL